MCDRHDECRRHTLAAHIAYAEEELLIAHKVVVEVATHLTGGQQRAFDSKVGIGKVVLWEHLALDVTRHMQFAVDALSLHFARGKPHITFQETIDDVAQQTKTQQHQQEDVAAHRIQGLEHFLVIAHNRQLPVRLPFHKGIIDIGRGAVDIALKFDTCEVSRLGLVPLDC